MRAKSAILLSALAAACLIFLVVGTEQSNLSPDDSQDPLARIVSRRQHFLENYSDVQGLLTELEKGEPILSVRNNSPKTVEWKNSACFFNWSKIRDEINATPEESARAKTRKIFNFVRNHCTHAVPLYESSELHHPVRFFSTYGAGLCDDSAQNMAEICALFGFQTRIWWLGGHVVADVQYDGGWQVYDPDMLGIVESGGRVASMEDLVRLGKNHQLGELSEIFSTTGDNSVTRFLAPQKPDGPRVVLFPGEERLFFDRDFMLTTDGSHLSDFKSKRSFLSYYRDKIANFVREIPLNRENVGTGVMTVRDDFPISGVFIRISVPSKSLPPDLMPKIFLDPEFFPNPSQVIAATEISSCGSKNRYLNLNLGVRSLGAFPSRMVRLQFPQGFLERVKDASLITVHYYCVANADFDGAMEDTPEGGPLRLRLRDH